MAVVEELKTWMSLMPSTLKNIPLIYLAIPGSHDSMSYGIRPRARVAPDAEPIVNKLYKVMPCVVRRWAITQRLNIMQQLFYGIRYFDLRTCMCLKDHNFYFVHGLYCEEITQPLIEMAKYLDEHPDEFIILDCQHFYNFANGDYGRLEKIFRKIFQTKFYTKSDGNLNELTLNRANALQKQLIIIYRYSQVPADFWSSDDWPTPWPNQIKIEKLKSYLSSSLKNRSPLAGYVSQCVLTPPVDFIIPRFYSSLRKKCAERVIKRLVDWIESQSPGLPSSDTPKCNVFIADFIELNNFQFSRIVVELNKKLLIMSILKEKMIHIKAIEGVDDDDDDVSGNE